MSIVNHRKIFYAISIILVLVSIAALAMWGLLPSIDFTGGTQIEVAYGNQTATSTQSTSTGLYEPTATDIVAALSPIDSTTSVRPSGTGSYIISMKPVDQTQKDTVLSALNINGASATVLSFDSVSPVLGVEALKRSVVSIILVILAIILYITWAFRKVSEPVASWKYGLVAVVSLLHDVIIPLGAFAILGHFAGYQVDTLFVTAILVILGFSVHNTIVVFDRVRENLRNAATNPGVMNVKKSFNEIVGASVSQTFTRSMNTSATVVLALVVLYIVGGSATAHFSLALIIGILAGTFSSVFIGSPLLVTLEGWQKKEKK